MIFINNNLLYTIFIIVKLKKYLLINICFKKILYDQ